MEHLTGDLVGLLDHLKIDKAIFVGHDWGGFVVWQMPLRHLDRVAGVVGVNTPHWDRSPADPIELFRKRFGDSMYIVQFQDPAREPDRIFGSRVEQTFDAFMRKPVPRKDDGPAEPPTAGVGASKKTNPLFSDAPYRLCAIGSWRPFGRSLRSGLLRCVAARRCRQPFRPRPDR